MTNISKDRIRCSWCMSSDKMMAYHDEEWGVPVRDSQKLFAKLILDTFQAGLSWAIVLNKREDILAAFDDFDPHIVAKYSEDKIAQLLENPKIIRNKLKVRAAVHNAQLFLQLEKDKGSFSDFLWSFVDGKPVINSWTVDSNVPATSPASDAMSTALKDYGFKFVGSTVCYAFMQAVGMINDHTVNCFRYPELTHAH